MGKRIALVTGGANGIGRMGRVGTPEEVAAAIAFLVSPAASFITGADWQSTAAISRDDAWAARWERSAGRARHRRAEHGASA